MSPSRILPTKLSTIRRLTPASSGREPAGAAVAAELAEGGMRVVVLEQGPAHDPDTFSARPPQMLARLYRDGGQTLTYGNPPIALPLGRGLGGTTLVNSGTCFRTPPHVLERWRDRVRSGARRVIDEPYFERVEQALSVAEVTPELAGENAAVARRGAERLGWSHGYLRRNAKGCVGLRGVRVRLPDLRQSSTPESPTSLAPGRPARRFSPARTSTGCSSAEGTPKASAPAWPPAA